PSRENPSIVPVTTTVLPARGPVAAKTAAGVAPVGRGGGSSASTPASSRSFRTPSPAPPGPNHVASAVETVGPTPATSAKRSGASVAISLSRAPAAVSQPGPAG